MNTSRLFRHTALIAKAFAVTAIAVTAFCTTASAAPFFLFGDPVQPTDNSQAYERVTPQTEEFAPTPDRLRRHVVNYRTNETPGTIIIDTANTYLYLVMGNGQAMRYGIGVGRDGFTWSGRQSITRKAEWPDWTPPAEMIERQPYLPRFMSGGPGNPLGARAMYLGNTIYRIHGTNDPTTIGGQVSSGCIRLTNEDVTDLYSRVTVGTKVVVLPATERRASATGRMY
jgi:lipoprotein-anchoring transpeptidase ErfK/SrfK